MYRREARGTTKYPVKHSTNSHSKEWSGPKCNSAEVKKPCLRLVFHEIRSLFIGKFLQNFRMLPNSIASCFKNFVLNLKIVLKIFEENRLYSLKAKTLVWGAKQFWRVHFTWGKKNDKPHYNICIPRTFSQSDNLLRGVRLQTACLWAYTRLNAYHISWNSLAKWQQWQ